MYSANTNYQQPPEEGRILVQDVDDKTVPDETLDLGAMHCPLLGLKTMKALKRLDPGQTVEISTTGNDASRAFKRVSWMSGAQLISVREEEGQFKHLLRKK